MTTFNFRGLPDCFVRMIRFFVIIQLENQSEFLQGIPAGLSPNVTCIAYWSFLIFRTHPEYREQISHLDFQRRKDKNYVIWACFRIWWISTKFLYVLLSLYLEEMKEHLNCFLVQSFTLLPNSGRIVCNWRCNYKCKIDWVSTLWQFSGKFQKWKSFQRIRFLHIFTSFRKCAKSATLEKCQTHYMKTS